MKNKALLLITILISAVSFAQQGINYKALIKDDLGNVISNDLIVVQFQILQGIGMTNVYQETHTPTTDSNGFIIVNIGEGSVNSGIYNAIDWAVDDHFLNVQINTGAGLTDIGTTQFMAVPYAKHAKTAEIANNVFSGDYNDLTNQPTTLPTGLEQITENDGTQDNTGWRLKGAIPTSHGSIGNNAIDLSIQELASTTNGATGDRAIALGTNTTASGSFSTAMGIFTTASGQTALASGQDTSASGLASTAIGLNTIASQQAATAIGSSTEASGISSTALGNNTEASGNFSTAIGNGTSATGSGSTAMGIDTSAMGSISTAMGRNTIASGLNSTAMGRNTVASGGDSTAMGYDTVASGERSTSMGDNTKAESYSVLAIGRFNIGDIGFGSTFWNESDPLFEIGNGLSVNQRNNALTIYKNGNAVFDSEIQHTSTGNANMIPIAYGSVNGLAVPGIVGGTGNFSVERDLTTNEYTIDVTGQTLDLTNTVASVVANTSNFRTVNVTYSGGNMIVHIFISNGTKVASPFQFTIYKL